MILIIQERDVRDMEERDDDVPITKKNITVGIVYNLKKGVEAKAIDEEAEYDSIATVYAISDALKSKEVDVVHIEAGNEILNHFQSNPVDIVFNIAEGIMGRGREAQVPALLNMLKLPFTGSDETTLCLALDKALTKRILSTYHIKTPRYLLVKADDFSIQSPKLKYPLIVKPNAEGSSKGVSDTCVVSTKSELVAQLRKNHELYHSDLLIEEYIKGREFTVGLLGNNSDVHVFEPMEIVYNRNTQKDFQVYSYQVKQAYQEYVSYKCPSTIDQEVISKMKLIAKKIFHILACRDFARLDFRVTDNNEIYFIEINPLPGLASGYSDYPMLAEFCGVKYDTLIRSILKVGAARYGLRLYEEDAI